ncbi:hypothetical protein PUN28_016784 [Cardiocondyla obscurior]
MQFSCNE